MSFLSQPLAEPSLRNGFLTTIAKKHPVALFFILAYALGWVMVTPRILFWLGVVRFNVPDWWVAASFYAPAIAGLCMQWLTQQNLKVFRVYESLGRLVLGLVASIRYATADLGLAFVKASIVWVNCESTSSAMIMTSGKSALESRAVICVCNVPKMVTWRIRDSWISMAEE
jgi:hypothetical protein